MAADPGQRLSDALGSKEDCITGSKGEGKETRHDLQYIYIYICRVNKKKVNGRGRENRDIMFGFVWTEASNQEASFLLWVGRTWGREWSWELNCICR